jgi:iron only hydrogenase large subunit-like protein
MTSSCCPAYVSLAEKHIPKLVPQISHTPSPMVVTARRAKQQNPDTHTIFIGPCIAKQQEALQYSEIDHVINFEELGALFVARGINLLKLSSTETDTHTASYGNWFAAQSGLTQAITHHLQGSDAFRPMVINGINKANIRELKNIAAGRTDANFVEVMACEGGCIAGPGSLNNPKMAAKQHQQYLQTLSIQPTDTTQMQKGLAHAKP